MGKAERIAAGSIGIGVLVLAMKGVAWWITGSAALYSDALESTVNIAASVVALIALRFAARPADANHPFGHDKAEFFAAVIEGVLIVVAAVSILQEAWHTYTHPTPIASAWQGMALNAVSTVLNIGWASVLIRRGRELRSPALKADGQHILSDVVTSVGALAGVGLVMVTGVLWLDAVVAALAAVYILLSGLHVMRDSIGGLMDSAPSPAVMARIRDLVAQSAEGAIEAHDMRTRHAGRVTFLQFHLVVPGAMSVLDAHAICDRIETALREEMDELMVTIHVEPDGKAKHHGVLVL